MSYWPWQNFPIYTKNFFLFLKKFSFRDRIVVTEERVEIFWLYDRPEKSYNTWIFVLNFPENICKIGVLISFSNRLKDTEDTFCTLQVNPSILEKFFSMTFIRFHFWFWSRETFLWILPKKKILSKENFENLHILRS